jgi:polyhydroxyalkanoate synthesis regulator phasin
MEIITAAAVAISAIIAGFLYKLRSTGLDVNGDGKINLEDAKAAVSTLKTEASAAATAIKSEVNTATTALKSEASAAATALKSEVSTATTALKTEAPKQVAKVTEKVKNVADVNKDGKVDLKDVTAAATKVKSGYKKKR